MKAKVAERGQVTIPKTIRVRFGIRPGAMLNFQDEKGRIVVTKGQRQNPVDEVFGTLGSGRSTDKIMHSLRDPS